MSTFGKSENIRVTKMFEFGTFSNFLCLYKKTWLKIFDCCHFPIHVWQPSFSFGMVMLIFRLSFGCLHIFKTFFLLNIFYKPVFTLLAVFKPLQFKTTFCLPIYFFSVGPLAVEWLFIGYFIPLFTQQYMWVRVPIPVFEILGSQRPQPAT